MKLTDATTEQRVHAGELGVEILHRSYGEKFFMTGEDNVLLGQLNNYSVVTDGQDVVIAAANTQHFFRLISEAGADFANEMRRRTERKLKRLFNTYYMTQLEKRQKILDKKQEKDQAIKLTAGQKIKQEISDRIIENF